MQEYLSLFKGPLPQGIINALITLFNLDKTTFEARDQALINMAGPEVADLIEGEVEAGTASTT